MDLSTRQARAIAASGYVFLIPLVVGYARLYAETVDSSSPVFGGGFGRWVHRRIATSNESDVSDSHSWLHSTTWLDVRAEPWILSVPSIGFPTSARVSDLWSHMIDESTGDEGDVGPLVITRGESVFVRCELRVELHEPDDRTPVRGIQSTYRVEALGAWSGRPAPPVAPAIAWWPCPPEPLVSMDFWRLASFALSLTVPAPDDRGILERLAEIGVVPGGRWDPSALHRDVSRAIEEGMDEAITELMRAADGSQDATTPGSRYDNDSDYFGRAIAAVRSSVLIGDGPRDASSSP